jgi:exopolyphosphatase/guanosine-5'-triphosphate,3'-diphosphate pyrophosphatase
MGCVSWSQRFFPGGVVTKEAMDEAIVAARREIASVVRQYRKAGWDTVIGSSGTIVAIESILQAKGASSIDIEGLRWLRKRMFKIGDTADLELEGLSDNRRPVIAGGVAILSAIFQALRIEEMRATGNALREGVLLDLVGRQGHSDVREHTVRRLMDRLDVDGRQAFRVQQTAVNLYEQCQEEWNLKTRHRDLIRWAAALHEVGLFMSYAGYHKHGAYLMTHIEMPGFSRQEQCCIAALIRGHRGKPTKDKIADIAPMWDRRLLHLVVLLRIATRIHRRRSPRPPPRVSVQVDRRTITLSFPDNWLDERPLSRVDLEEDAALLKSLGYTLSVI